MSRTVKSIGDIAIVGMAGRFPGATDVEAFWRNLRDGVESVTLFTAAELAAAGVSAELLANPAYVRARPVLADADKFDAEFFGITPREAEVMDPQQRVFMETAWAALEQAGYDSEAYEGAIGLFGGQYFDTYLLANLCTNRARTEGVLDRSHPGAIHTYLGNDKDYLTTRVAYKLNLRGPAVTVLTACSTSLTAVVQACQSLLCYQCDMALAGGVAILAPQQRGYLAQEGGMVSPDGHCRPFDARAQGTLFGNGCGLVVLKRLPEAVAEGDHIHAVIKGAALNNDGSAKVSFTAPSVDGQAEVIALAQALAGVTADTISYIEAHGTGTPVGDPIEVAALTLAFQETTSKTGFCGLGSLKGNVGHLDAAAGVAGVIKTALALQHRVLPPTVHFTAPNPQIDFANSPFYVVSQATEWKSTGGPRRAGVSSFGVGGTNAHVVLEEAPARGPAAPARPVQLLTLSAKTPAALDQATGNVAAHLQAHPKVNLADVAYTLRVGRRAFAHRRVVAVRDVADAAAVLAQPDPKRVFTGGTTRRDAPVAFLFPGQGAQVVNMGAELYEREPVFRAAFDRCARLLPDLDLRVAIGAKEQLAQTQITQPALFVIEYALAQLWLSWGVRPAAMIGHSVGEYVAGCLAGVFTLEDALRVVAERARLVQAQPAGAMVAVRLPEREVQALLGPGLSIAAVNAPGLCIVAGPFAAIEVFEHHLKQAGKATIRLQTSHAFHSAMMEPVVAPLAKLLRQVALHPPQIPYISNVTGEWITTADATNPDYWASHVRQPVRFATGVAVLLQDPALVLLEVGPGQTLSTLARQHSARQTEQAVISSLGNLDEQAAVLTALGRLWSAGVTLDPAVFYAGERRERVPLPTYPFQRQRYWVEPEWGTVAAAEPRATPVRETVAVGAVPETIADQVRAVLTEVTGRNYTVADEQTTFVELGFESLSLTQVTLAIAARFGVRVAFRQLFGEFATVQALAEHLQRTPATGSGLRVASAEPVGATLPVTEPQREIWLATAMSDAASCAFNQSCTVRLRGALRLEALRQALQELVRRHAALRTTFSATGETQQIAAELTLEPVFHDFTAFGVAEQATRLDALLVEEAWRPFDLARGPLVRVRLVRLAATEHVVLFSAQHIVCDGGSVGLLLFELGELYSAASQGQPSGLPAARSYGAYVEEEARQEAGPVRATAEAYWLGVFAETPPVLELPLDRSRPPTQKFQGARTRLVLPAELMRDLRQAGARQGCTLFTTLLAAYYLLLQRLTGLDDIVVGIPTRSPAAAGAEPLVAHTVNFQVARASLAGNPAWSEHLAAVQRVFLAAYEHRQLTYVGLLQKLKLSRDLSRIPLVSVGFNFAQTQRPQRFAGLETVVADNPHSFTNLDLIFDFDEAEDGVALSCLYNSDLFEPATIERWTGYFVNLLQGIAAAPQQLIGELPLQSPTERRQVLEEWNATAMDYPRDACLHELVEAQVAATPAAVAAEFGGETVTYGELNARADRLAEHLRAAGVQPGAVAGIYVERSLEMLVGLLGILKAGGAYLPLDPSFPAERLAFMLEDARPVVLLTQQKLVAELPPHKSQVLCVDALPAARPGAGAVPKPTALDLAYVLYTSGSTGKPKGVQIPHQAIVNFLASMRREPGLNATDVLVAVTTLSFDIAGLELYLPLVTGARVVIASREAAADGVALAELLASRGATVMQATPATWRVLLAAGWAGNPRLKILCGGEALPAELAAELLPRCGALWNMYGPTETAVWSAVEQVVAGQPIRLGHPIGNTTLYVVDSQLRLVPLGVPGELLIGGAGLARGYWKRPELTAEKFIAHPFQPGERVYRTGDFVRRDAAGRIEFLGRLDHQVKVRGFRIELGEIEVALAQHPAVREVVVVAREDVPGDQRLVAYLVVADGARPASRELRPFLLATLPEYMVPTAFVVLAELPLTPNGKVNRAALPAPDHATRAPGANFIAPRTPLEEQLAGIWRELLQVPRIGAVDNFFELGGHSLLAVQAIARVRAQLQVEVPLRSLFEKPTVAAWASHLENLQWARRAAQRFAREPAAVMVRGEI